MSCSLLVGWFPYWNYANTGIYPVLDEITFSGFFCRHSWCVCTLVLYISFSYWLSVSIIVDLHSYWYQTNVGIYPVLDEITFWNILETFIGYLDTISKWFRISLFSLSLLVVLLPYWYLTNKEISPVLNEISFWIFLRHFW